MEYWSIEKKDFQPSAITLTLRIQLKLKSTNKDYLVLVNKNIIFRSD